MSQIFDSNSTHKAEVNRQIPKDGETFRLLTWICAACLVSRESS
jgi:hypothetical protein